MKFRGGFVSNSSSSSFIIGLDDISASQIKELLSLDCVPIGDYRDYWDISMDDKTIIGYTSMDNGGEESGMHFYLKNAGFPMNKIRWTHD